MNADTSKQLPIETDEQTIRAELDRVLSLRRFSGAPQMSAFLRYIVTETLAGHADRIKAFSVGVDALGKPDTFDAQSDPSVRVLALRLRKTLSEVYENMQGCNAIIDLRVGTYVPTFYSVSPATDTMVPASDDASINTLLSASVTESHVDTHVGVLGAAVVTPEPSYKAIPPTVATNIENTVQGPK